MRMSRIRLPLSSGSPTRPFSTSSILRASAATTKVSSSSSVSTSPPPPPPPRRRPRLLSLALWNEVANNDVLQEILGSNDLGILLAGLGRYLGSKPERNGGAPTPKELTKVVRIHRSLKELGLDQKDLRTAMEGLVGVGLFDSHQPSPPTPSSSLPSSTTSPPTPCPLTSKSSPNPLPPPRTTSSVSPPLPAVDSLFESSVAYLARMKQEVASLDAKLRTNPTSPHRQEWTKNLEILQARVSDSRSGVKTVSKPREEITARLNLMEELDSKDGGDRVETQRRLVLEKLKALEAKKEAGLGISSNLQRYRLEWKILQERSTAGRKEDASEPNGSPTSASLLAPGPPPPPTLLTTTSPSFPLTLESSSPLPSLPPTSSPSLSPLLEPTAAANAHSSLLIPSTSSALPPPTHNDSLKASDELIVLWKRQAAALETKLHFETDATEKTRTEWRRILGDLHARLESGRRSAPDEGRERAFEVFRGTVALDSKDGGRRFETTREKALGTIRSLETLSREMTGKEERTLEKIRVHVALLEEFARERVGKEDASGFVNSSTTIPPSAFASPPPPSTAPNTPPTSTPSIPPHPPAPTTSPSSHVEPSETSLPSPSSSSSPQLDPTSPSSPPLATEPNSPSSTPVVGTESFTSPSPDRVASLVHELPTPTTPFLVQPLTLLDTSTIGEPSTSTNTSPAAERKEEVEALESQTESSSSSPSKEGEEKSDASPVLGDPRGIETSSESVAGARVREVGEVTSEARSHDEEEVKEQMGEEEESKVEPTVPKPKPSLLSRMFGRS